MKNEAQPARREFLSASVAVLGGLSLASCSTSTAKERALSAPLIRPGATVLFQGDSITDAGRNRESAAEANQQAALGNGYAWLAAVELLLQAQPGPTATASTTTTTTTTTTATTTTELPPNLRVFNRGISGHKVFQLANRWQQDCIDLQPDVLSILIGVNDIWHSLGGNYDGTVEIYERDYDALLARTRKELPTTRIVVCEPFVLRCGAVNDKWFPQFDEYRAAARRVADKHHATFVAFQSMFDQAIRYAPPEHWAKDGVHPSRDGAALMAHTWLATVNHAHLMH